MPALVWSKALHKEANFRSQVRLEFGVRHFEVVQQLMGQRLDVALIDQGIHQVQGPPEPCTDLKAEMKLSEALLQGQLHYDGGGQIHGNTIMT